MAIVRLPVGYNSPNRDQRRLYLYLMILFPANQDTSFSRWMIRSLNSSNSPVLRDPISWSAIVLKLVNHLKPLKPFLPKVTKWRVKIWWCMKEHSSPGLSIKVSLSRMSTTEIYRHQVLLSAAGGRSKLSFDADHSIIPRATSDVYDQILVMCSRIFDLFTQILSSLLLELDHRFSVQSRNLRSPETRGKLFHQTPQIVLWTSIAEFPCTDLQKGESLGMASAILIFEPVYLPPTLYKIWWMSRYLLWPTACISQHLLFRHLEISSSFI
jgi:hypothetical protein